MGEMNKTNKVISLGWFCYLDFILLTWKMITGLQFSCLVNVKYSSELMIFEDAIANIVNLDKRQEKTCSFGRRD